jgi:Raf kinase inhibitor-like YbhB/YbcL family protein
MDRQLNRRTAITGAALAAGLTLAAPGTMRALAQATPEMPGTPTGMGAAGERNPYEFLAGIPTFTLMSTDVQDGVEMSAPQRSGVFGGGGEDLSPQLSWSGQPEGIQSYVVTMYDADAPTPSGFWHWAVFNIPGDTTELPTGASTPEANSLPEGSIQLENDASLAHYIGAAPPAGRTHRYFIGVFGLDVPTLDVPETATPALLSFNTLGHILGYGMLVPIASTEG